MERRSIEQRALGEGVWTVRGTYAGDASLEADAFPGLVVVPAAVLAALTGGG